MAKFHSKFFSFPKLGDLFRKDLWRKLTALGLALLLYIVVSPKAKKIEPTEVKAPISIVLPPNIIRLDNEYRTALVHLEGSQWQMDKIQRGDLKIEVRPEVTPGKLNSGTLSVRINPENVIFPPGRKAKIGSIVPKEFDISIDRIVTESFPVKALFTEKTLPDQERFGEEELAVSSYKCLPAEVKITASNTLLKLMKQERRSIMTEPISIDSTLGEGFSCTAKLVAPEGTVAAPTQVRVEVSLTRKTGSRIIRDVPLTMLLPPRKGSEQGEYHYGFTPAKNAEITISGNQLTLAELLDSEFRAFVDVSSLTKPGNVELPVSVYVPPSKTPVSAKVSPAKVTVTVERRK
ncbi:MAG: CdaR family protein [Victivallaceae bacterium]|nr:CdaR family protein [Victivallaceae bacterium]